MIQEPFSQQLAAFPAPLRALVEAELEAGNSIEAIEHGFPAAPCGASVKLARAVTGERRRSVGEVQFYARNNPSYAGEFTTAERHFFVLEPPLPLPPEPDMDAVRAAHEPKPNVLSQLAQREAGSGTTIGSARSSDEFVRASAQALPRRSSRGRLLRRRPPARSVSCTFGTTDRPTPSNSHWSGT